MRTALSRLLSLVLLLETIGTVSGQCSSQSAEQIQAELEIPQSKVLFIGLAYDYAADGRNIYNYLKNRMSGTGHSIEYIQLTTSNKLSPTYTSLSSFTQASSTSDMSVTHC